jgi:hypothetical protein
MRSIHSCRCSDTYLHNTHRWLYYREAFTSVSERPRCCVCSNVRPSSWQRQEARQARAGKGREGQARAGKGGESRAKEGKGRQGQARVGKVKKGHGGGGSANEDKGRKEQTRAGKGS